MEMFKIKLKLISDLKFCGKILTKRRNDTNVFLSSFLIFFQLIKYEFCHFYLRVLTFMFALSDVLVSWDE